MQHLLRATSGPLAGATYVLGPRTTIGRASDCDIQIVHEGISRRHAKLTVQDDGRVVVSDLSSDNGTFVDGQKITRCHLEPGQELRLMRTRFTYERLQSADVVTSAAFRRKITSGDSLRQTADHGKVLAAIRSEMAKGLVGVTAERSRPNSRPQAAAPAPSGARPGAAGSVSDATPESRSAEASAEQATVRRPNPGEGAGRAEPATVRRAGRPPAGPEAATVRRVPGSSAGRPGSVSPEPATVRRATRGIGTSAPASAEAATVRRPNRGEGSGRPAPAGPASVRRAMAGEGAPPATRRATGGVGTVPPSGGGAPTARRATGGVGTVPPSGGGAPTARRATGGVSTAPPSEGGAPTARRATGGIGTAPPSSAEPVGRQPVMGRGKSTSDSVGTGSGTEVGRMTLPWGGRKTSPTQERPSLEYSESPTSLRQPTRPPGQPTSNPAGRMAPLASVAISGPSPTTPRTPPVPGSAAIPGTTAHPSTSGTRPRVPRPIESPRSMRPGTTQSALRRVGSEPPVSPAPSPPPSAEKKHRTAEYGLMGGAGDSGERPTDEPSMSESPSADPRASTNSCSPQAQFAEVDSPPSEIPTMRPGFGRPLPRPMPAMPVARPLPARTAKPAKPISPATVPPSTPQTPADDDAVLDRMETKRLRRIKRTPSSSEPVATPEPDDNPDEPPLAYEDTLRFERPERDADGGDDGENSDKPQARQHVTSGELINALEDLLPRESSEPRLGSQERPDAQVHQPSPASMPQVGQAIQTVTSGQSWSGDDGMQPSDQMEMRVQQVLEQANREQAERQGLEVLIDILEYRELRVRSLRGEAIDEERFQALQTQLQQESLEGHDTAAMRRYHRYVCSISAQLTHHDRGSTSTVTVEVEDLSAGGAKVTFGEYSLDLGDVVSLAFDLTGSNRPGTIIPKANTVVFKARVVWKRPHDAQVGLIFAGVPRYDDEAAVEL